MTGFIEDATVNGAVNAEQWAETAEVCRAAAAQLINANTTEIAFMKNTTQGILIAANGIDWRKGDNVVTTAVEFPANIYPWWSLKERYGVQTRMVPERDGYIHIEDIASAIDTRTRALTISHVEFASGFRNDIQALGDLCREHDIWFIIDAIQSLGAIEVDVKSCNVDILAADGHKWLLAPEGAAIFYCADEKRERLINTNIGWSSVVNPRDFLDYDLTQKPDATRFEEGSYNSVGLYGLKAAIDLLLDIGALLILNACTFPGSNQKISKIRLTIQNTLPLPRKKVPIVLTGTQLRKVNPDFTFKAYSVVTGTAPREVMIPAQADDLDYDGERDQLCFLLDLESEETKEISILYDPNVKATLTLDIHKQTRAAIFPELNAVAAMESNLIAYILKPNGAFIAYGKKRAELFSVDTMFQPELDYGRPLSPELRYHFENNGVILSQQVQIEIEKPEQQWVVRDLENQEIYFIRKSHSSQFDMEQETSTEGQLDIVKSIGLSLNALLKPETPEMVALNRSEGLIGIPHLNGTYGEDRKQGWVWSWGTDPSDIDTLGVALISLTDRGAEDLITTVNRNTSESSLLPVILVPDAEGRLNYRAFAIWGGGIDGIETETEFAEHVQITTTALKTPPHIKFLPKEEGEK
ncbi:Probable cysteine desulfurase [Geodia barretti]|uniref:Probable cysteine desulfurase n=1 Tax=Geodia barretti TaxID=519541 RepID=A0AA35TCH8_GEOBA|nr:Probable cysteine desulfurase [Geodia barretti]